MKTHVQIVAALHIAGGAFCLVGAAAIFVFLGMAGGIVVAQGDQAAAGVLAILAIGFGVFLGVLALPGIIGGLGLFAEKRWARPLVLVLGILHLANIPFGTALGVYTLWALLSKDKTPMPAVPSQPGA